MESPLAPRIQRLPTVAVLGRQVPVAAELRARLLGLALLDREEAGVGLLIPRCSSVHTFGMRFLTDVVFLDAAGRVLAVRGAVPPRRLAWHRCAAAVFERPALDEPGGGEIIEHPTWRRADAARETRDRQHRRL